MPRNPHPLALSTLLTMSALATILAQPQTAQATCYLNSRSILVTEDCTTPQDMGAWPADQTVGIMMEGGECCDGGGCPGGCTYSLTDLYMPEALGLYRYERGENQQMTWTPMETPIEHMGQCHGFARYGFDTVLPPGEYKIGNNNATVAFKVTTSQDIALRPVFKRYQISGGVMDGPCANGPLTITPLNDNRQTPAHRGTGQNNAPPVPTTTHGGCAGCAQPAKKPTSPWPWATVLLGLGVFAARQRVQRRASERSNGLQEGVSSV